MVGALSFAPAVVAMRETLPGNPLLPWRTCRWRMLALLSGTVVEQIRVAQAGEIVVLELIAAER